MPDDSKNTNPFLQQTGIDVPPPSNSSTPPPPVQVPPTPLSTSTMPEDQSSSFTPTSQTFSTPPPVTPEIPTPIPEAQDSSIPPATPTVPPAGVDSPKEVVTPPGKIRDPHFLKLLWVFIAILVLVLGVLGYLYFGNSSLRKETSEESVPTIIPTPAFNPEQIQIIEGSIYQVVPVGEKKLLVHKNRFADTGITGFARVAVSPNYSKMCFESWPPAPAPKLYYSPIDGGEAIEVAEGGRSCFWTKDSKSLIFTTNPASDKPVNIALYTLETGETRILTTEEVPSGVVRTYEITGLSQDGSAVLCKYADTNERTEEIEESTCEVPLVQASEEETPTASPTPTLRPSISPTATPRPSISPTKTPTPTP